MYIRAKLRHGLSRSFDIEVQEGTTIQQIKSNAAYRVQLGLSENVVAVIDGNNVSDTHVIQDGDTVIFERQAAAKAAKAKKATAKKATAKKPVSAKKK